MLASNNIKYRLSKISESEVYNNVTDVLFSEMRQLTNNHFRSSFGFKPTPKLAIQPQAYAYHLQFSEAEAIYHGSTLLTKLRF